MSFSKSLVVLFTIFLVIAGGVFVPAALERVVLGMVGLAELGFAVRLSAALFTLGCVFLIEGDCRRLGQCADAILLLGLLGTTLGFAQGSAADGTARQVALAAVFLHTAQALIEVVVLTVVNILVSRLRFEWAKRQPASLVEVDKSVDEDLDGGS